MSFLKKNEHIAPTTFFATLLNAPCTSLLLTSATPDTTVYLIVGKSNGEAIFFPTDRSECISKYKCEFNVPITSIVAGDLRNNGKCEIVTITSNGLLQSMDYPRGNPPTPSRLFFQQIHANVCTSCIFDIDKDGQFEFVILMTDRVVRSYRYLESAERLIPLNKWEMPSQISGFSIGFGSSNYAILSQCNQNHYIRLDFGPSKEVRVLKSMINVANNTTHQLKPTQFVLPSIPYSATLLHCLIEKIIVVNNDSNTETELRNVDGDISCLTVINYPSGLIILIALDPWGQMLIYGWFGSLITCTEPLAKCQVLRDVEHICAIAGPTEFSLIIGLVNIYNKVALISIDLAHIISNF